MRSKYYKTIDNKTVWYEGVILTETKRIFTWDENLILADGWTKYIPTPHIPTLDELKEKKIAEITNYDSSSTINEFFIDNQSLWLDKETRVGLNFSLAMEKAAGKTISTLWYNTIKFELPITLYEQMLTAIELYAKDCFNVTAQHKLNVYNLTTKEEVENYDYTTNYPEKITFTTNETNE